MTDIKHMTADRGPAFRCRRLVVVALTLALAACGGARGVFTGAPYTGNIEPQTVPRVEPTGTTVAPSPAAQPPAVEAAPAEDVDEEPVGPAPGFEVTVEPPEEITEPLPTAPEPPAEEAAPPIMPQSQAMPPASGEPSAAAESTAVLPRPPSPDTFPNLADVPERPTDLPTLEERARALAELQADQAEARPEAPAPE